MAAKGGRNGLLDKVRGCRPALSFISFFFRLSAALGASFGFIPALKGAVTGGGARCSGRVGC